MKPSMDDQEFVYALSKSTGNLRYFFKDVIDTYSFTPDQITKLCEFVVGRNLSQRFLRGMTLTPEQVDILLTTDTIYSIRLVFKEVKTVTPKQIEFGLSHDDEIVRMYASRHPNCTEAQKVFYHLKWGYE